MDLNERIGTAQRTTALELLSKAVEEGYLDLDEYDQRVVTVHSARTVGDVVGQLRDLPHRFHWDPRQYPVPAQQVRTTNRENFAVLALVFGILSIPMAMCVGIGVIPGMAAMFLGRIAWRDSRQQTIAVVGAVLGLIGVAFSIMMIVATVVGSSVTPNGR